MVPGLWGVGSLGCVVESVAYMPSIAFSVDIDRPVAKVFAFTNDPQLTSLWQTGVLEEVLTPDNPIGVGAMVRRTAKRGRRTVVSEGVCVEFVPNERVVWEMTAGSPPRGNVITYAAVNGGTRYTFAFVPRGWLAFLSWPLRPFLARALTRVVARQLGDLKRAIEAQIPPDDDNGPSGCDLPDRP